MSNQTEMYGASNLTKGSHDRPRVTLALFAYKQQAYVRSAVQGALAQDYEGPLEIILSDDTSPDATFTVMQKIARSYTGPHHVRLNRNDSNLGLCAHVNRVLAMAQGEIIVMAAGDDISLPSRVSETVAAFARHPTAMAVSFTDIQIDDDGHELYTPPSKGLEEIIDLNMFLAAGVRAQGHLGLSGSSRAFRRDVYDQFGDLRSDCPAEDTPYLRRALYLGNCVRCDWAGICYRIHARQMSTPKNIAAMNSELFTVQYLTDLNTVSALCITNLPLKRIRTHVYSEAIGFELRGLRDSGRPPSFGLTIRMILSADFRFREKLGFLKRFLSQSKLS